MQTVRLIASVALAVFVAPAAFAEPRVPEDATAWFARALMAEQIGNLSEAERDLAWVLRVDGENPNAVRAIDRFYERHPERTPVLTLARRTQP